MVDLIVFFGCAIIFGVVIHRTVAATPDGPAPEGDKDKQNSLGAIMLVTLVFGVGAVAHGLYGWITSPAPTQSQSEANAETKAPTPQSTPIVFKNSAQLAQDARNDEIWATYGARGKHLSSIRTSLGILALADEVTSYQNHWVSSCAEMVANYQDVVDGIDNEIDHGRKERSSEVASSANLLLDQTDGLCRRMATSACQLNSSSGRMRSACSRL